MCNFWEVGGGGEEGGAQARRGRRRESKCVPPLPFVNILGVAIELSVFIGK